MSIFDVRREIEKNQEEIQILNKLITAFWELNEQSADKIKRYEQTIDGAYKDQRYGLVLDCRDAINKETAKISQNNRLFKERERQKECLIKRTEELKSDLKKAWNKEMKARRQSHTYKH